MNQKIVGAGICIFCLIITLNAEIQKDIPARGEYVFPLEKIWETDAVGDQLLGNPSNIWVADDGRIFCYDRKNFKYYILDLSGKLINAFGKRGEGPGEIQRIEQAPLFLVNRTLIVMDTGKLHYFDREGHFIRSVVFNPQHRPNLFLDENEYLSSPRTIFDAPDGKATIRKINLLAKKENIIKQYDIFEGGVISSQNIQAAMVVPTLTPLMIIERVGNKVYYGMSDRYRVNICDLSGIDLGTFGLDRKKNRVSEEIKIEIILRLAKGRAPEELLRSLAKKLPDEETYIYQIVEQNGLLYLMNSHFDRRNIQKMDVFSLQGKFLYRASIDIGKGSSITSGPVFKKGFVYLAMENEDGDTLLVKYKTTYPK